MRNFPESVILANRHSASKPDGEGFALSALIEEFAHMDPAATSGLGATYQHSLATWVARVDEWIESGTTADSIIGSRAFAKIAARLIVPTAVLTAILAQPAAGQIALGPNQNFDVNGKMSYHIAVRDFDGDGDLDMAGGLQFPTTGAWVRLNQGSGVFSTVPTFYPETANAFHTQVAADDIDNDGDLDVLLSRTAAPSASGFIVLSNSGAGNFSLGVPISAGVPTSAGIGMGDFDNDGDPDVVIATYAGNQLRVFRNDVIPSATLTFAPVATLDAFGTAFYIAVGDVSLDNVPDICAGVGSSSVVRLFPTGNFPAFAPSVAVNVGSGPQQLALSDFNGDGRLDLASANFNSSNVSVALNTNGSLQPVATQYFVAGTGYGIVAADLDLDGDCDLAVTTETPPRLCPLANSGNGTFTAGATVTLTSNPRLLATGDLDGDGDTDIVGGGASLSIPNPASGFVSFNETPVFWTYGTGCPGTGGLIPTIAGTGVPQPGNNVSINVANGLPNASGLLLFSTLPGSANLPGTCTLLVGAAPLFVLPGTLDAFGQLSIPFTVPPVFAPFSVYLQFFVNDTGAPNFMYSSTNGLRMGVSF